MEIPRLDNMSNRELIFILVGLLVVFGLVSAFIGPVAELGGDCCPGTIVMNKVGGLNQTLLNVTNWEIMKYSPNNTLLDPNGDDVEYYVNITELETRNNTLIISGNLSIRNNGANTAYIANVVDLLYKKVGPCTKIATNVVTYDDSKTTLDTCKLQGSSGKVTHTEGLGSGEILFVDSNGVDVFASSGQYTSGLYPIPTQQWLNFTYTSSFELDELSVINPNDNIRDQIIVTFIKTSDSGNGVCKDINALGSGKINEWHLSTAWKATESAACADAPDYKNILSFSSNNITFYDMINSSPDQSIVSVPNFDIDSSVLNIDGSPPNFSKTITATGVPGTVHQVYLNSSATCVIPVPDCELIDYSAYADSVIDYNVGTKKDGSAVLSNRQVSSNALGAPEYTDVINFVTLGFGGNLTVKFDGAIVPNATGNDIILVETSYNNPSCTNYPEKVDLYASKTGTAGTWKYLGQGCLDSGFNLSDGGLEWAKYLMLVDASDNTSTKFNSNDDGYDVDGIVATTCHIDDYVGGETFVRNKAWLEIPSSDNIWLSSLIYGSPSFSQIDFFCNVEPPPVEIGDICTFTQDSYGGLNTTGFEVMDANATFPIVVGNATSNWISLTTSGGVQDFLPQNGTPSYITLNYTDPTSTSAKSFAGEVVALHLNVKLSDEGDMPQTSDEIFGNLSVKNTASSFDGMQVREVLDIANCLLANGADCSGYTTANISELNGVLEKLNINYYNCENDFNYTGPEDGEPPVIISVEATPDLLAPGHNYIIKVNVTDDIGVVQVNITVNGSKSILTPMGNDIWQITLNAPPSGTHIIYVNAYDGVGNSDYDDGTSINVDSGVPVITLNSPLNNSVISPGTTLNFSVTDANLDSVEMNWTTGTTAGTTLVDFASPFDIDTTGWADGIYTVYIWANDTVGNNADKTFRFTIDSADPVVSVEADPEITNKDENVTFTAEVDDENYDSENVYLHCENGAAFTVKMTCTGSSAPYTCTYEWNPVNDGEYTCTVTATDEAGNSGTSDPITVIIDSVAPHISLNDPTPENSYIPAGTEINITVTNDEYDDLEEVWYSTDGGLTNHTLPNTTDPLYYIPTGGLECEITFDVWASDTAGNVGYEDFVFNLDKNDPVINMVTVSAPSLLWPSMLYNVTVNATDTKMMDFVNVTVNGVEYTLIHSTGDIYYLNGLVAPGPGTYPVNVTAYDKSGKMVYDDTHSITVTLPPGPIIVLDSPANGATITNSVPILVNITNSTIIYQVDTKLFNSSYDTTLGPFDSSVGVQNTIDVSGYPDGTYIFSVFANDTNGVESTATYTFTIDSTAPIVANLTIMPNIFSSGTSVTFTADVYENLGLAYSNRIIFTCKNSSDSWMPSFYSDTCSGTLPNLECSTTIPISYADGLYQCQAYAEDNAGSNATSAFVPMTIDSTPPVITLNDPFPSGQTINTGTTIDLTVTNGVYDDLDTVLYQVDGGSWMPLLSPFDIPTDGLSEEEHCFNVTANDTAGNSNTASFCFRFDDTPPVIVTVTPDPDHFVGGGPFDIKVNVTDLPFQASFDENGTVELFAGFNSYNLTFNSSSGFWEETGLYYAPPPEVCGIVYLTVTATDEAGNSATDTETPLYIVGCEPMIMLINPGNGDTISQGTTIDIEISHPFPISSTNYSVQGVVGSTPLPDPYDVPANWPKGATYSLFVETVDIYGYYSNATFTFTIPKDTPPGPPDGDEDMDVSWERVCPEDGGTQIKLIAKDGTQNLAGVNVKLYHNDFYLQEIPGAGATTGSSGEVAFSVTSAGEYAASFREKAGYNNEMLYDIELTLCPPVTPPGCDLDIDCPTGEYCVNGNCEPPECTEDLDCPIDQFCVNGNCEPIPPECTEDADCATGEVCLDNECVPEPPECETDADCADGFVCKDGTCEGVPGIIGDPEEGVIGEPGENTEIEFNVTNIGTVPLTNVNLQIGGLGENGEVLSTGPDVPILNPGESAIISAVIKIGENALPGDYTFPVTYSSDEASATDQFSFSVAQDVIPGILFEDAALCLLPLLLLLILLALLPFLKKKVVMDGDAFKGLANAKKLNLLEEYFVVDSAFLALTPKMRKNCKGVKVEAAKVATLVKRHKLTKDDASLVAVAQKVKSKRIITTSKTLVKLVKLQETLEGIKFVSLDSILKPKK